MAVFPQNQFFETMFFQFDRYFVRYVVLRNYEHLPYDANGSDLDILVHPEDKVEGKLAIQQAIAEANGVALGEIESDSFVKIFVFGNDTIKDCRWWGIRLDISVGLRFAGVADLVDYDILHNGYVVHNGIRVLPEKLAAVLGVLKEVLHNDLLPARYLSKASEAAEGEWDQTSSRLAPLGPTALTILRDLCTGGCKSHDVKSKSRYLRRSVLKSAFLRNPLKYVISRFNHQKSKFVRLLKPSGIIISVLGTDGVGKSTIISAIEPLLSEATHGAFFVKHLRPGLLPPLARLLGKKNFRDGPVSDPHGSVPSGYLLSFFRLFYLMCDYVVGYWVLIRHKIARSPAVVIYDRYVYDILFDPRRFRINLPEKVIRSMIRWAPRPNLIFCLYGNPEVVADRKRELSLSEVQRQTNVLQEFADKDDRAILICTDHPVEVTRDLVLNKLWEFCSRRSRELAKSG